MKHPLISLVSLAPIFAIGIPIGIAIAIFWTSLAASAQPMRWDWPRITVQILTNAKTLQDFQDENRELDQAQKAQQLCRAELSKRQVPASCGSFYALAHQLGLVKRQNAWLRNVGQLCVESIDHVESIERLQKLGPKISIFADCHARANARIERLVYEHPGYFADSLGWPAN